MHFIVKLLLDASYAEQMRKYIEDNYSCESEYWMQCDFDESIKDY